MDHIAIDLGSRTSQICVRDAQGQIVDEQSYTTRHLGTYLRRRPAGQVIVETSSEAVGVARMAQEDGPMKRRPDVSTFAAKSGDSERKP